MDNEALRVAKLLKPVELWIHPEGRVVGSIYLRAQSGHHAGLEQPQEILNQSESFLVLRGDPPDEPRFYSKRSVIRVEYRDDSPVDSPELVTLHCRLHMMDGSILIGAIKEILPPARQRLFDYINNVSEAFIKLYLESDGVCLINKAYIVRISPDRGDVA